MPRKRRDAFTLLVIAALFVIQAVLLALVVGGVIPSG
jgi:hypothetical protein